MKQRYCKVTLYNDKTKSTKVFTDLAVTFEIDTLASVTAAKGIIKIAGLSSETLKEYTMFIPNFLAKNYYKKITLEVGYTLEDKTQLSSVIFNGYIVKALPTALPERWLVCEVIDPLNSSFEGKALNYTNISLFNLVANLSTEFGISKAKSNATIVDYTGKAKSVIVKSYIMYGNLQQHLEKIKSLFYFADGYRVWLNNGQFFIGDYSGASGENSDLKIGGKDGLLIYGIPQPTVAGVTVRTQILDTIRLFRKFKLESSQIPDANGLYTPLKLKYVGETRGTNWYCEITAINPEREIDRTYDNG